MKNKTIPQYSKSQVNGVKSADGRLCIFIEFVELMRNVEKRFLLIDIKNSTIALISNLVFQRNVKNCKQNLIQFISAFYA